MTLYNNHLANDYIEKCLTLFFYQGCAAIRSHHADFTAVEVKRKKTKLNEEATGILIDAPGHAKMYNCLEKVWQVLVKLTAQLRMT